MALGIVSSNSWNQSVKKQNKMLQYSLNQHLHCLIHLTETEQTCIHPLRVISSAVFGSDKSETVTCRMWNSDISSETLSHTIKPIMWCFQIYRIMKQLIFNDIIYTQQQSRAVRSRDVLTVQSVLILLCLVHLSEQECLGSFLPDLGPSLKFQWNQLFCTQLVLHRLYNRFQATDVESTWK